MKVDFCIRHVCTSWGQRSDIIIKKTNKKIQICAIPTAKMFLFKWVTEERKRTGWTGIKHSILKQNINKGDFCCNTMGTCSHDDAPKKLCCQQKNTVHQHFNPSRGFLFSFWLFLIGLSIYITKSVTSVFCKPWLYFQLISGLQSQRAVATMYAF